MNVGHGHVFPRKDGQLARCGGPQMCGECMDDYAKLMSIVGPPLPPGNHLKLERVGAYTRVLLNGAKLDSPYKFRVQVAVNEPRTLHLELPLASVEGFDF